MGKILDKIRDKRPVIGTVIDFFVAKAREEVVTYPDGTQETVRYGDGVLRDRALVTLVATGLIGLFNWNIETTELVELITKGVEFIGIALSAKFIRDKYEIKT